jgi:hypothetical protein
LLDRAISVTVRIASYIFNEFLTGRSPHLTNGKFETS